MNQTCRTLLKKQGWAHKWCSPMAEQKQGNQLEHTYSSYMRIRDVVLKTYQRRWMIGRSGERGSGISVQVSHDDDDDDIYMYIYFFFFHHKTCESTCDTLLSSTANQGNNTVSVAQGTTAAPGATKQLLPPDRVLKELYIYIYIYIRQQ